MWGSMAFKRVFTLTWKVFVVALLCMTTISGMSDVFDNIHAIDTALRKLTLIFQVLYTASGAVALAALLAKRPWYLWALGTWAISITITATVAPPAWGDAGFGPALAAGGATAAIAGLTTWWTYRIVGRSF